MAAVTASMVIGLASGSISITETTIRHVQSIINARNAPQAVYDMAHSLSILKTMLQQIAEMFRQSLPGNSSVTRSFASVITGCHDRVEKLEAEMRDIAASSMGPTISAALARSRIEIKMQRLRDDMTMLVDAASMFSQKNHQVHEPYVEKLKELLRKDIATTRQGMGGPFYNSGSGTLNVVTGEQNNNLGTGPQYISGVMNFGSPPSHGSRRS